MESGSRWSVLGGCLKLIPRDDEGGWLGVRALPGEKAGSGLLGGVTIVVGAAVRSMTRLCLGIVVLILAKGEEAGLADFSGRETIVMEGSTAAD